MMKPNFCVALVFAVGALDNLVHELIVEITSQFGGDGEDLKQPLAQIAKDDPGLARGLRWRLQLARSKNSAPRLMRGSKPSHSGVDAFAAASAQRVGLAELVVADAGVRHRQRRGVAAGALGAGLHVVWAGPRSARHEPAHGGDNSRETFGHAGGFSCIAWADPAQDRVFTYLSKSNPASTTAPATSARPATPLSVSSATAIATPTIGHAAQNHLRQAMTMIGLDEIERDHPRLSSRTFRYSPPAASWPRRRGDMSGGLRYFPAEAERDGEVSGVFLAARPTLTRAASCRPD